MQLSGRETATLVIDNVQAGFRDMAKQAGYPVIESGLFRYNACMPLAHYNGIMPFDSYNKCAEQEIETALNYFEEQDLPHCAWVLPGDEHYCSFFEQSGFVSAGTYTGVVADLTQLPAVTLSPHVSVYEVATTDEYDVWVQAFCESYEIPHVAELWKMIHRGYGAAGPLRHFVAELDGKPVGTLTLCYSAGAVGFWNAVVGSAVRGQGVATAILSQALGIPRLSSDCADNS